MVVVADRPIVVDTVALPVEEVVVVVGNVHRQYHFVSGIVVSPKSYSWAHNTFVPISYI